MAKNRGDVREAGAAAYVTAGDFAAQLGVSVQTVYRMLGEGALAAIRVGRQWRIDAPLSLERLAAAGLAGGRRPQ